MVITESSQAWDSHRWIEVIGFLLGVIGFVLTVITIIFTKELNDRLTRALRPSVPFVGWALIGCWVYIYLSLGPEHSYLRAAGWLFLISGVCFELWRYRLKSTEEKLREATAENQRLSGELDSARKEKDEALIRVKKLAGWNRGRWESVTEVRFGHLRYEPFLRYGPGDIPDGPGVDWLTQLLNFEPHAVSVHVIPARKISNWSNVLQDLNKKKEEDGYDVVATPLFATFDRSELATFTAPLFFSNMGFYVSEKIASRFTQNDWRDMTLDTVRTMLKRKGHIKLLALQGEISKKLADKYGYEPVTPEDADTTLSSLLERIADSEEADYALFCESIHADLHPNVKGKRVRNVLPWHKILYPVCFAVRRGDYQLANLLNIRLLQLNHNGGALSLLAKELARDKHYALSMEDLRKHFVAEWPCDPNWIKDGTDA